MASLYELLACAGATIAHDAGTTELCTACAATARWQRVHRGIAHIATPPTRCTSLTEAWNDSASAPPPVAQRLYLSGKNVRALLGSSPMSQYAHITQLALFPEGMWRTGTSLMELEGVSAALSSLPSLTSLALGNVLDASLVARTCVHLRSLAVYGTAYWTQPMERITRFTCVRLIGYAMTDWVPGYPMLSEYPEYYKLQNGVASLPGQLFDALSGSTSLTALRLTSHVVNSKASVNLVRCIQQLPNLAFLALERVSETGVVDHMPCNQVMNKCTNAFGSLSGTMETHGATTTWTQRFEVSNFFYVSLWLRGDGKHGTQQERHVAASEFSDRVMCWVVQTAPMEIFQHIMLCLKGWLSRDQRALRFDPAVLARRP